MRFDTVEQMLALQDARINTLNSSMRAVLTVMREWLKRVEIIDGVPMVRIGDTPEDVEKARKLYQTMLRAYRGE